MAERKRLFIPPAENLLARWVAGVLVFAALNLVADQNILSKVSAEDLHHESRSSGRLIFNSDRNPLVLENGAIKVVPLIETVGVETTGGGSEAIVKSPEEIMQAKWVEVQKIMEANPDRFSEQDFIDLGIYFPIYWEAGKKYDLPWYLLWVIHQEESHVSRDPNGLNGSNGYETGMQLTYLYTNKSYVADAMVNIPDYVFNFPTRDSRDIQGICAAAKKLHADGSFWGHEGDWAIIDGLHAYSAAGPAERRAATYLALKETFG